MHTLSNITSDTIISINNYVGYRNTPLAFALFARLTFASITHEISMWYF